MKQDVFPARQGARKRRSQWLAFGIFKLLSYSIVHISVLLLVRTYSYFSSGSINFPQR